MLVLNHKIIIDNMEVLNLILEELDNLVYNDITEETFSILSDYLYECFNADIRLTEMTQDKLGEDIYPLVFIDLGECDDLNAFNFSLTSKNEDRKIKFAEEKSYYHLCDICFGHIVGLFDRIYLHFEDI